MGEKFIGLDIGGTKCAVLLAEVNHGIRLLDKIRFATCSEKGFTYAWENLCSSMEKILERNGLTFADIRAVGASCGGPLDSRRGLVLSPPNLPGWDEIPLPKMIEERCGVPAFIQNDANACALVEWKLGAGRGTRNMVFLTMGTGMGAGIIAEGQLLCGHTDMGGEVGHIRLTEDGPVGFGKAGSFEGYTSGGGIGRQATALTEKMMAQGKTPAWVRDGYTQADAKLLADYARQGDEDAKRFYGFIGKMLGRGISQIVDVLNPECIVIGSVFVRCEDLLRVPMEAEISREALVHSQHGLRVVPAQTGEALGDLASIMVALYNLDIDPLQAGDEDKPEVLAHYERLFECYPVLDGCRDQVMRAYCILRDAYAAGNKLLVGGCGSAAADGERMADELVKGLCLRHPFPDIARKKMAGLDDILPGASSLLQQGLPAIALSGPVPCSTVAQNNRYSLLAMAQQTVTLGKPGDVLMSISTSGNAKDVGLALKAGKTLGLKTIGLTSGRGGMVKEICDCAIVVPGSTPADAQELYWPVCHTLCAMLVAKFFDA